MVCAPEFRRAHQSLGTGSPRSSDVTVIHLIEADGDFTCQHRHLLGFPKAASSARVESWPDLRETPARARGLLGLRGPSPSVVLRVVLQGGDRCKRSNGPPQC